MMDRVEALKAVKDLFINPKVKLTVTALDVDTTIKVEVIDDIKENRLSHYFVTPGTEAKELIEQLTKELL